MGWLDYHLHEFRLLDAAERNVVSIGIPTDDEPEDRPVVPGWQVPLSKFFDQRNWHAPPATYAYDFGDDWQHVLVHEGFESADDDTQVPALCRRRRSVSAGGLRWCARLCGVSSGHRRSRARGARVNASVGRGRLRPGGVRPSGGEVRRSEETLEEGIRATAIGTSERGWRLDQRVRRWHRRRPRRTVGAVPVCLLRPINSWSIIPRGTRRCSRQRVGAAYSMFGWSTWTRATT